MGKAINGGYDLLEAKCNRCRGSRGCSLDNPGLPRQSRGMKLPERDALGIGALVLAAVFAVWLGVAGPIFSIDPKKLNDAAGIAAWAQVLFAAIAIVAVYIAATIPVRAEKARREDELRLRRQGLALLLISEVLSLKGEVETAIKSGNLYKTPIQTPESLRDRLDELYILGETGGRLLQTVGILRGMAVQTQRFQTEGGVINGVPVDSKRAAGVRIWNNHVRLLTVAQFNLDEAVQQLQAISRS